MTAPRGIKGMITTILVVMVIVLLGGCSPTDVDVSEHPSDTLEFVGTIDTIDARCTRLQTHFIVHFTDGSVLCINPKAFVLSEGSTYRLYLRHLGKGDTCWCLDRLEEQ